MREEVGVAPWLPLGEAPSPRSRSPFPTPHRMTRAAPQQTGLERIPEPHPSPQSPAIFQTAL